ncbi:zinc finger protein 511-like [Antedon mediterranea]|uniref:zinc finger protein 511-like n=1 Tax=Antedon mediterranea TaxID=105859 RepID=UPI003AF4180A
MLDIIIMCFLLQLRNNYVRGLYTLIALSYQKTTTQYSSVFCREGSSYFPNLNPFQCSRGGGKKMAMPRRRHGGYYIPLPRRYSPWHTFFEEGDIQCASRSKQVGFEVYVGLTKTRKADFVCHITGCHAVFTSVSDFEMHYNISHWNVCSQCKQWFPSNHLLNIHFQECHDSFFDVMKLKEKMFQCLVESCDDRFMTAEDRTLHLIQVHHYPSNFEFSKPSDKNSGSTERSEINQQDIVKAKKFPREICFGQDSAKSFFDETY